MPQERVIRSVENYTLPFFVMTGAVLFMAFFMIAAAWGYLALALVVGALDSLIQLLRPKPSR
ncbi:hypothetical protein IV417_17465 [Alphaproteobacteria bacterium KMM 3653]|uniref:Uncharacterized protein n=1 Tax=Harenicola maris TaxID=2841044 RepID=A0AAP2CRI6_9RHOB|nr:hypothetical protein [Harenicola maris]